MTAPASRMMHLGVRGFLLFWGLVHGCVWGLIASCQHLLDILLYMAVCACVRAASAYQLLLCGLIQDSNGDFEAWRNPVRHPCVMSWHRGFCPSLYALHQHASCHLQALIEPFSDILQECQVTPCLLSGTGARFGSTSRLHLHLLLLLKQEKKTPGGHPAPGPPQAPPLSPHHWSLA